MADVAASTAQVRCRKRSQTACATDRRNPEVCVNKRLACSHCRVVVISSHITAHRTHGAWGSKAEEQGKTGRHEQAAPAEGLHERQ